MADLRVELLGTFRVTVDGRPVADETWHRRKPAALVKLLALAPAHRLHREQVMDALWPDLDPAAAGANLRKALHHARRGLGADGAIESDADLLWLPRDDLWLDIDAFRTAVAAARRTGDLDAYRDAVGRYRDGLLPDDRYEPWAEDARDEVAAEHLAVLEELAGLLEARGDLDGAIDAVRRLVDAEPLREESHATLIRLYALAGRRTEALRAYEHLGKVLDAELGIEPGATTQRLFEEVRAKQAHDPELDADLWERVGDLRVLSGDATGAAKAYGTAVAAGARNDVVARLERKCADAWLAGHRADAAAGHLAAAEAAPGDPAERVRLLRARAHHAWETGDIAAAQRYAEQARDAAETDGTAEDVAAAYEALAIVAHFRGDWRDGLTSELHRLADDSGPAGLARVFDMHHCIGQYHLYGDGLSESVEPYARQLLDRAEDAGAVRAQAFAWCLLGESLLLQARWDEAAGCLDRSCELHTSMGSRSGGLAWQRRAELAACRGTYDEVEDNLRHAAAIATVSPMALHLWGRIHATRAFAAVEQGDPDRAVRSVRAAATTAARYGDCPTCSALLNPVATEAFAMLHDPDSARPYTAAAARVGQMFASAAWQAMAAAAAAGLARAEGDPDAARAHLDTARAAYERAGMPYWAERSGNAQGTPAP